MAIAIFGLTGCAGDGTNDRAAVGASPATPKATAASTDPTMSAEGEGDPLLIKTSINGLGGKVVTGSVLGDSAFCSGGSVRHDHGSPEIGYPAVNVFLCSDGQLKIGFGPGAEQMDNSVQTSDWKILDGSGRFSGMTGNGQMIVQWSKKAASEKGSETFTGRVVTP
jgi:hypothetical protein